MLIVFGVIPGLLYLISLATIGIWRFSSARTFFIMVFSLLSAIAGVILGNKYWVDADRSGDASALTAGGLFGIFIAGPCAGLITYWVSVAFSALFRKATHK